METLAKQLVTVYVPLAVLVWAAIWAVWRRERVKAEAARAGKPAVVASAVTVLTGTVAYFIAVAAQRGDSTYASASLLAAGIPFLIGSAVVAAMLHKRKKELAEQNPDSGEDAEETLTSDVS